MNKKSVFAGFTAGVFLMMVFSVAGFAGAATQKKVMATKSTTMTCALTENGTVTKRPALVKLTQNREGSIVAASVSIKSGKVMLVEMTDGHIAWRPTVSGKLQIQKYASQDGVQKCSILPSTMSAGKGVSVVGSCSILPESGMPVETTAKFELRIALAKDQNFGFAKAGNRFYVAGYNLADCK